MLALRISANSIRNQSYRVGVARICFSKFDTHDYDPENGGIQREQKCFIAGNSFFLKTFTNGFSSSSKVSLNHRSFSSQTGAESSDGEPDIEDGFSELEEPLEKDGTQENEDDAKDLLHETENNSEDDSSEADEDQDEELGLSDLGKDVEEALPKSGSSTSLLQVITSAPRNKITSALSKYAIEGHSFERNEVTITMLALRKRRLFAQALQLSQWVQMQKCFEFIEQDYASRVDLIAKVNGINRAEKYIEEIPESFRGEIIYRTLLANCVGADNIKKSEHLFNKMRDLGLPLSAFACNQLLVLYKRLDRKKISDVLLMMEKENIKPTKFTYRLLIDVKGRANDIESMEQIFETMKAEGLEEDKQTQATVARHYISAGFVEKAEAILKEIEGNINDNRWACKLLLPLYAALRKADEVERIWKVCEANPRFLESLAAIEAWGKLGHIENAEEIFKNACKSRKKISPKFYNAILKVYANHKLLNKGKDLVKKMSNEGCWIGPVTWDALIKLYLDAGEVEKADSVLHKALEQSNMKPLYCTYVSLLDKYAKRGDIHNAEKIFYEMRKMGYNGRLVMYQSLLEAYINAKTPAYGFRERMKADNLFPNNKLAGQLTTLDGFRKTLISDIFE